MESITKSSPFLDGQTYLFKIPN